MRMLERRGSCGPNTSSRTRELMPSAPTTRSKSADVPSSKRTLAPLPSSSRPTRRLPSWRVPSGSSEARSRCRSDRITVSAVSSPLCRSASPPAKVSKASSRSKRRSSVPSVDRDRMDLMGFPISISLSPRPIRARTAAPPLMLRPAPSSGRSSLRLSNTVTCSTPVLRCRRAIAELRPAGPEPITATRLGAEPAPFSARHVTKFWGLLFILTEDQAKEERGSVRNVLLRITRERGDGSPCCPFHVKLRQGCMETVRK
mmetsp:Transcript_23070/g.55196  ORF Transcript_23070/g.55196 Transcript_23070/m.55196 type:complete len:258 (+) Transcript_23070:126-899(+)